MLAQVIESIRGWAIELLPYRPLRLAVAFAVIVVFFLVASFVINKVFDRIDRRLARWQGRRLRAIRWQDQELLSETDVQRIGAGLGALGRRLAYLGLILTILQAVFVVLPETQEVGTQVLTYVVTVIENMVIGFVGYLPELATIVVLYFLAKYLAKFARVVFMGIGRGRIKLSGFEPDWAPTTYRIVRGAIWVLFVVLAFPYFPLSGSPAFQGLSIFFGVLFSLGGSQMVANLIAGVMLTYTNAFKVGDRVRIADAEGVIVAKTTHVTRIRTAKNVTVSVPNSLVMNNHIINFSTMTHDDGEGLIVHTAVTIGYDVPYETVEDLLLQAALASEYVEKSPEPFVLQTALNDFYVTYQINAYTQESRQMPRVLSGMHRNILRTFHEAGVEIASPHLSAVRDGNAAAMPPDNLPKNYQAPSFRMFWEPREGGAASSVGQAAPESSSEGD